jgi:hypothetical protein
MITTFEVSSAKQLPAMFRPEIFTGAGVVLDDTDASSVCVYIIGPIGRG